MDRLLRKAVGSALDAPASGSLREALVADLELAPGGDEDILRGAQDRQILNRRTTKAVRRIKESKGL